MISHKHKVIFIHVPKCAGSSIEKYFGVKPFDWRKPNYNTLCGWSEELGIHLQHATVEEIKKNNLIENKIWNSYFKFAFVRDPWEKALSDYYWLMKDLNITDTFENYLNKCGKFDKFLNCNKDLMYRGDHLIPQINFLKDGSELAVDFVGRFERFNDDFNHVRKVVGLDLPMNYHEKKAGKNYSHYSHIYNKSNKNLVRDIYHKDIEYFNYKFVNKKYNYNYFRYLKYRLKLKIKKYIK